MLKHLSIHRATLSLKNYLKKMLKCLFSKKVSDYKSLSYIKITIFSSK